jgi:predicted DCC family thiol-disulfide oxidoreductase YuxK
LLPRPLADWLYDRVAQNRYALFGRTDSCMIPPPEWRERFIE